MFVYEDKGALVSYSFPKNDRLYSKDLEAQFLDTVKMYPQTQLFRGLTAKEDTWRTPHDPHYAEGEELFLVVTLPLDVSQFLFPKLLKKNHTKEQAAVFPEFFRKVNGVLYLTVRTVVQLNPRMLRDYFGWPKTLWGRIWNIPDDHTTSELKGKWRTLCLVSGSRQREPIEWMLTQRCVPRLVVESILADMVGGGAIRLTEFLQKENISMHHFYNVLGKPSEHRELQTKVMQLYAQILEKAKDR